MRSEFEKNVIHKQIIDRVRFSEKANQYLPVDASSCVDRSCADVVNVGWISYQYQQSKVDELRANFDQHDQWLGQRNRDVQELNDIIAKHVAEKDELQKRVDAALKMISINRGFAWRPESISQLEQALKGESNG